jgi:hypothetical protein
MLFKSTYILEYQLNRRRSNVRDSGVLSYDVQMRRRSHRLNGSIRIADVQREDPSKPDGLQAYSTGYGITGCAGERTDSIFTAVLIKFGDFLRQVRQRAPSRASLKQATTSTLFRLTSCIT